jgi:hypothetical protein
MSLGRGLGTGLRYPSIRLSYEPQAAKATEIGPRAAKSLPESLLGGPQWAPPPIAGRFSLN